MTHKICVFGATGRTGSMLIRLAVERGLAVVAFSRNEAARGSFPEGVTVMTGSLTQRSDVERAIAGCDAVLCTFGPRAASPDVFCTEATQTIIDSMKAQGVKQLLCITGAMIGEYPKRRSLFMRSMKSMFERQQPAVAHDREEQEKRIEASGLDWTIIKPPRLTDGKTRGRYQSGEDLKVGAFSHISRSDLSGFMLDQLDSMENVSKRVVVQY